MNTSILENTLKNILFDNNLEVQVLDVFEDKITNYGLVDGNFTLINEGLLTEYLQSVDTKIDSSYITGYMNLVSIPKLKESLSKGTNKVEYVYKTINGKTNKAYATIVEKDSKELIFILTKKENENVSNLTVENDSKYNILINRLADSILKINNVFNLGEKSNIKSIEEYINSIFSSITTSYPELKKSLNATAANISGRKDDVILIVDDDALTRNMIKKVFNDEYKTVMAANGKEAITYLEENSKKGISETSDKIITIFLDLTMPVLDGFAVLEYLSKNNYLHRIPVIIISGDYEKETKARVYNYGIADMLEKPFDFDVVRHRINNFINLYKSSNSINDLVNDESKDLKDLINPFIEAYRYDYKENINSLKNGMKLLGNKVIEDYEEFNLNSDKIEKMAEASEYYDIGFYSIPRTILTKKESLSQEEVQKIKEYPLFGSKMLDYVFSLTSDAQFKEYAVNIAKYYHENYDGTGYPSGLKESEIPIESQIASIIIAYMNMKKKQENAFDIVISKASSMFNPKLIDSFIKIKDEIDKI